MEIVWHSFWHMMRWGVGGDIRFLWRHRTGVTGLMTGADLTRVLSAEPAGHRYLLPDVCLSDDSRLLDGVTVDELPRTVEIVSTDGFALRSALERAT